MEVVNSVGESKMSLRRRWKEGREVCIVGGAIKGFVCLVLFLAVMWIFLFVFLVMPSVLFSYLILLLVALFLKGFLKSVWNRWRKRSGVDKHDPD